MGNSSADFSLVQLFVMGGVTMWPLTLFSIITVVIVLERLFYFFYHNLKLDDLKEKVENAFHGGNVDELSNFLESHTRRRMGARILLTLVKRRDLPEHRLEKLVEAEALSCISSLENGFSFLTALGAIAPLTGFLGTVTGMISAFKSISEAVDVNAQIVASGIYEALITTVFGLCIAIVALAAHSIFTSVVDRFASEVEIACSDLIITAADSAGLAESGGIAESRGNEKPEYQK